MNEIIEMTVDELSSIVAGHVSQMLATAFMHSLLEETVLDDPSLPDGFLESMTEGRASHRNAASLTQATLLDIMERNNLSDEVRALIKNATFETTIFQGSPAEQAGHA